MDSFFPTAGLLVFRGWHCLFVTDKSTSALFPRLGMPWAWTCCLRSVHLLVCLSTCLSILWCLCLWQRTISALSPLLLGTLLAWTCGLTISQSVSHLFVLSCSCLWQTNLQPLCFHHLRSHGHVHVVGLSDHLSVCLSLPCLPVSALVWQAKFTCVLLFCCVS